VIGVARGPGTGQIHPIRVHFAECKRRPWFPLGWSLVKESKCRRSLIVKTPTFSDDGEALVGALSTNRVPTGFRVLAKMDVTSHICL
jgi:hypothetical protein